MKKLLRRIPFVRTAYFMATGILSNFLPNVEKNTTGNTYSARYCYSVWMRHLKHLEQCGMLAVPKAVAEFGPGESLGMGLCALLSGADRYYALDIGEFADTEQNLIVFEELIKIFRERENIPDNNEFPEIKPALDDFSFPSSILSNDLLARSLEDKRLEQIRDALRDTKSTEMNIGIQYIVPWTNYKGDLPNVGLIFSQATLEHVDELENLYPNYEQHVG